MATEFAQKGSSNGYGDTWSVVLAGGEGTRLRALTTNLSGVAVPKQYCSLWGGCCLLEDALARGGAITSPDRVCAVVAAGHRRWWSTTLAKLSGENVIVQPRNRGTGIGVLLALLKILARDPHAIIVLLPADHYLQDEAVLESALRVAAEYAAANVDRIYLLGVAPDEPDPEFGYIIPAAPGSELPSSVVRFVEKPDREEAAALLSEGALFHMFIVAGSVTALLDLYKRAHADAVDAMSGNGRLGGGALHDVALARVYESLPDIDFSRDLLTPQPAVLRVLRVPACGWSDLGTPAVIAKVLETPPRRSKTPLNRFLDVANLSLAARWIGID